MLKVFFRGISQKSRGFAASVQKIVTRGHPKYRKCGKTVVQPEHSPGRRLLTTRLTPPTWWVWDRTYT